MNLPKWLVPWRKHTDQNTVTPIAPALRIPSRFGTIIEAFGGSWQTHVVLETTQNLLGFSAVYACISLISGDISKLRIKLMRRAQDGIWDEVAADSPFLAVLRKPNRFQTRIQFLAYWLASKLMFGNAYILLERDARGVVRAMYPLDPRGVQPLVAPDGSVYYKLSKDWLAGLREGDHLTIPAREIIHDRCFTPFHPLVGVAPLYACGASATQGLRIQNNSEAFFKNMSRPSGHLSAPGTISDPVAERLKKEFENGFSGSNVGRLFVSGDGLKFEPFTMPAEQAQLIEQQKWTVEDVARAFQMPLYKIQAGQSPTFNNVGALNQEYYSQCLQLHIESIEILMDEALGLDVNGMGVELDTDGLMRMDPLSRAEANDKLVKAGILAPNEGRAAENRHPVAGGESPYLQQQNYSLAALAKRDAKEDPFGTTAPPPPEEPANDDEEDVDDEEAEEAVKFLKEALLEAA